MMVSVTSTIFPPYVSMTHIADASKLAFDLLSCGACILFPR